MSLRELSPVRMPSVIILGILGSHSKVSEQDLHEKVLTPILQETGRLPDRVLLPTDGISSYYIQDWAESLRIPTQLFHTDWKKNGKAAQIFRDNRIVAECTHALVFLSPRSERYTKLAETMTRKGKMVFTSSYQDSSLELLELEQPSCQQASKTSHKSDKETMLKWLRDQKK
jgi:hypothetical protein